MARSPNKPMITLLMEQELVDKIDEFAAENGLPSRARAIKYLCRAALKAKLAPTPEQRELLAEIA